MTPVITLRDPIVTRPPDPDEADHEVAYRLARSRGWADDLAAIWAASAAGLPTVDENGDSIPWTMRAVRRHIFGRYLVEHGHGDGDVDEGAS